MELKLGYKQTEVGVIPEDWETYRLKDLADIQRGASPRPIDSAVWYDSTSNVGWVRISDVTASDGKHLRVTTDYFSKRGVANSRYLPSGSLIMSICATVGMPVITRMDACIHDGFVGFTKLRYSEQDFLYYKLKELEPAFKAMGQTGSQANLNSDLVRDCLVALPPLPEQGLIARTLGDVDVLLGGLEKLIAKKRDIKLAAMQQLLTGQTRPPGIKRENAGYKKTEVGVIPEDWDVKALGDIFEFSGGFTASRDQLSKEGYCYLHYGDIHRSSKTFVDVQAEYLDIPKLDVSLKRVSPSSLLKDGDVVFVDASEDDEGTSKHIVINNEADIPCISGLHTIVAKSKGAGLDNRYKQFCFNTANVKRQFYFYAAGTKVSGISKTNIARIFIPLPPSAEQCTIAAVLSDMDAELAALEQRLAKTRALKQGMMQELLTGKIRLV